MGQFFLRTLQAGAIQLPFALRWFPLYWNGIAEKIQFWNGGSGCNIRGVESVAKCLPNGPANIARFVANEFGWRRCLEWMVFRLPVECGLSIGSGGADLWWIRLDFELCYQIKNDHCFWQTLILALSGKIFHLMS